MSGTGYDNAQGLRTYGFFAAAVDTDAVFGRIIGPAGKKGRIVGLEYHNVAAITGAASAVTVDTNAGLTAPLSVSVEVAAINTGGAATQTEIDAADELPADTIIEVASDGGATAGDSDVFLTVQWY